MAFPRIASALCTCTKERDGLKRDGLTRGVFASLCPTLLLLPVLPLWAHRECALLAGAAVLRSMPLGAALPPNAGVVIRVTRVARFSRGIVMGVIVIGGIGSRLLDSRVTSPSLY